jgi:hypothetical protein
METQPSTSPSSTSHTAVTTCASASSRSVTSGTLRSTLCSLATSVPWKKVWDDIIAELDSDWGTYIYVAGLGA